MTTKNTALDEFISSLNETPTESTQPTRSNNSVIQEFANPTTEPITSPRTPLDDFQPKNIKDRSLGFQVFRGTYTLDDLERDPEFQMRANRFMESIEDDENIFEYLRDSDFSLSSAFVRAGEVKGWSDQAKEDYNYLRQVFDNADVGSTKQYMQLAKDLTVDLIADPLNWLAAAFFVPSGGLSTATGIAAKQVAAQGWKKIASETVKGAKKPALYGAAEGAAWAGPHDFFLQKADVELGLRDKVNYGQVALTTGLGAGLGGLFGGAIGAVTTGTPLLYNKYLSKYSDDVTISKQGDVKKEEVFDEYIEEQEMKLADDDTQAKRSTKETKKTTKQQKEKKRKTAKRITKVKEAISNTFGKPVTQFADIAQNSEKLQQLLGHFRSDWAKTLVRGVDKVMLATYGEEVSKRTYGYMTELRSAVSPLNRTNVDYSSWKSFKQTLANGLDKTQNDNLIYLLRLNRKDFAEIAELKKSYKFDAEMSEDARRSASLLDDDVNVEVNIIGSKENDAGVIIDDEVIIAAAKVRDILDRIFYEASGKIDVFDGIRPEKINLMSSADMVSNFFPRHFAYSKINDNPEGLIEIIKNSPHSDPQLDPKDTAKLKVIDPNTGEVMKNADGTDMLVFKKTEVSIDENVFGRGNYQKIKDLVNDGKLEEAKQFKAELIVQDMLDRRYSPFEFATESSGGGGASFLQHRVFSQLDDNALAPYLENNIEEVLESYIQNASRAITRTAYFGRTTEDFINKYIEGPNNIKQQLLKAGVKQDEVKRVNEKLITMYERVTGLDSNRIQLSGGARYFTDALKLTQQMAHLPLATISSLTEPMILLTRIDDTEGKLSAGGAVGKAIVKGIKKDVEKIVNFYNRATGKKVTGLSDINDEYWQEAYKVGLALEQGVMAHIEGLYGEAPKDTFLQGLQNAFFKGNFLTTWTGSVQVAAFTTGKRLIRENAEKLYQHSQGTTKLNASKKEYLERQLNDLGIDEKDAVRWYKDSLNANGVFDEGRSRGASTFGFKKKDSLRAKSIRERQNAFYQNRLTNGANRFTKEIILNPSTAEANRPLWFSHPAGQLLAQFAGYPTVFNNTVLKRWAYEASEDLQRTSKGHLPQATPKIIGTALAMTSAATLTNAIRSGGASLEQDDETILLEAVQRWGGLGPADFVYRTQQNSFYGSGPAGTALKALPGPIVGDVVDAIAYRKGLPEIALTNFPFFSALPPELRKEFRADARRLQKGLAKGTFNEDEKTSFISPSALYAKGGIVDVPNASIEPDEKKVRGLPLTYAELGGVLAQDVEDRQGFVLGGFVRSMIKSFDNTRSDYKLMPRAEKYNLFDTLNDDDELIKLLTKDFRKAEPIFESNAKTSLYTQEEAEKFSNVNGNFMRYIDSDKLHDLEQNLRYSNEIGLPVYQTGTVVDKKNRPKFKQKGKLRLNNSLSLDGTYGYSYLDVDRSYSNRTLIKDFKQLASKSFPIEDVDKKMLPSQVSLLNTLVKESPLSATEVINKLKVLNNEFKDVKTIRTNSELERKILAPDGLRTATNFFYSSLETMHDNKKIKDFLIDLGFDSIKTKDGYNVFDYNQFRVTKKLTKYKGFKNREDTVDFGESQLGLYSKSYEVLENLPDKLFQGPNKVMRGQDLEKHLLGRGFKKEQIKAMLFALPGKFKEQFNGGLLTRNELIESNKTLKFTKQDLINVDEDLINTFDNLIIKEARERDSYSQFTGVNAAEDTYLKSPEPALSLHFQNNKEFYDAFFTERYAPDASSTHFFPNTFSWTRASLYLDKINRDKKHKLLIEEVQAEQGGQGLQEPYNSNWDRFALLARFRNTAKDPDIDEIILTTPQHLETANMRLNKNAMEQWYNPEKGRYVSAMKDIAKEFGGKVEYKKYPFMESIEFKAELKQDDAIRKKLDDDMFDLDNIQQQLKEMKSSAIEDEFEYSYADFRKISNNLKVVSKILDETRVFLASRRLTSNDKQEMLELYDFGKAIKNDVPTTTDSELVTGGRPFIDILESLEEMIKENFEIDVVETNVKAPYVKLTDEFRKNLLELPARLFKYHGGYVDKK